MMHVVQVIDTLKIGGAQQLLVTFAETVKQREIELTIVSLNAIGEEFPMAQALERLGARLVEFPARKMLDPLRMARLVKFLQGARCDALYTHLTYANVVGTLAARIVGLPVVANLHNTKTAPQIQQRLESWVLRHGATRIVAVGQAVEAANRERLRGRKLEVVPNAVREIPAIPEEARAALREEVTGDGARPLLLSVGRLTEQKGYGDLLVAFAALRERHPSAFLAIAGQGSLAGELAAQIERLGLQGHARLLGPRDDVPRLLAASDLFVSSSHWEGLPVALLEAMAAGLPVVATTVGDVPHVVVEGTGLLVPPREPACLAEALASLLDDPARQRTMSEAARAHVRRYYSAEAWVNRLLALYPSVNSQPAGPSRPQEAP